VLSRTVFCCEVNTTTLCSQHDAIRKNCISLTLDRYRSESDFMWLVRNFTQVYPLHLRM